MVRPRSFATLVGLALVGSAVALAGCIDGAPLKVEAKATGLHVDASLLGDVGVEVEDAAVAFAAASHGLLEDDTHADRLDFGQGEVADLRSHALADARLPAGNGTATARSVVGEVMLLGGLVTADGIVAQANAGGADGPTTAGSGVAGLFIAGIKVRPTGVTQSYSVAGHEVRVHEVEFTGDGGGVRVTMLRVTTADGEEIRVGEAYAWANYVYGGSSCVAARSEAAALSMGQAGMAYPLDGGSVRTAARSEGGSGFAEGHIAEGEMVQPDADARWFGGYASVSTSGYAHGNAHLAVRGPSLLGGLVEGWSVLLSAHGSVNGGQVAGSVQASYVDLTVAGEAVPETVPPNTLLGPFALPEGGEVTVVLNEQSVVLSPDSHTAAVEATAVHVSGTAAGAEVDLRLATVNIGLQGC